MTLNDVLNPSNLFKRINVLGVVPRYRVRKKEEREREKEWEREKD